MNGFKCSFMHVHKLDENKVYTGLLVGNEDIVQSGAFKIKLILMNHKTYNLLGVRDL